MKEEKELNEIKVSKLTYRVQNNGYKDTQELSENLSSTKKDMKTIKKQQSEMKDTLPKTKSNLQGINSSEDEA